MKTKFLTILVLIATLFSLSAQDTTSSYITPISYVPETYTLLQKQTFACTNVLDEYLLDYEVYDFDFNNLYEFVNSNNYFTEFKLVVPENSYTISLQRNDLRSGDYTSVTEIEQGNQVVIERTSTTDSGYIVKTFKGFVNGDRNNIARFTINEYELSGYIYDAITDEWLFFDSYEHLTGAPCPGETNALITYYLSDVINLGECELSIQATDDADPPLLGQTDLCTPKILEIATEADYLYYQDYGNSANNANEEILSILNKVEGVYSYNFNVMFSITEQHVWAVSNDPYNSDIASTVLHGEFRSTWNTNFTNVDRDLAVMFTGQSALKNSLGQLNVAGIAPAPGGILTPGTVCRYPTFAYVLITDGSSNFLTTAHEIGHSLNMPHPFEVAGNTECVADPGIMCYGSRGFFFNQSSIDATVNYLYDWGGCLDYIDLTSGIYNDWIKTWDNEKDKRWIGSWYLKSGDKHVVGDFDGDNDEEILFMSTNGWCNMVDYSCEKGSGWHHMWSNNKSYTLYTWVMREGDQYFCGDFDGDGISEVLAISYHSKWATLQEFNNTSNNWSFEWSNMGNRYIGGSTGWYINSSSDKFIIDDFTNDGKDDLLCVSSSGWGKLFTYDGAQFNEVWSNSASGYFTGTSPASNSWNTHLSGDFNDDGTVDLLVFSGTWVTMIDFNATTNVWNWKWSQYGATHFAFMYILPLTSQQRMLTGNFDIDDKIEVLNINNSWSATADWWNNVTFQQNWNNGGNNMFSDWFLNTPENHYFLVRPTAYNKDQVIAIKLLTGQSWCKMYRSNEINNMILPSSITEDTKADNQVHIILYPNPSNDYINVKLLDDKLSQEHTQINIYSLQGRLIQSKTIDEVNSGIDVSNFEKGVYNIQILINNQIITNYQIIVQ